MSTAAVILATLAVLAVIAIAVFAARQKKEGFQLGESVSVTWAPPAYQFPSRLVYDWGVCAQNVDTNWDIACNKPGRNPADPTTWSITGAGVTQPSVTISACGNGCGGYPLRFGVRARDPVASPAVVGPWAFTAIDLSGTSKGTLSVHDPSGLPLVAGSTGLVATLALAPGAAKGAAGHVGIWVTRSPGYTFFFAPPVPLTSADGAAWQYTGSFAAETPTSPWLEQVGNQGNPTSVPPGPLQSGDTVTVIARVAVPGPSAKVFYWASTTLPAVGVGTLAAPAGFSWQLA